MVLTNFTLVGLFSGFAFGIFFAIVMLSVVALITRGRSNRGTTIAWAIFAAIAGFLIGHSLQNAWFAFDQLYLAPFAAAVLTQSVDFTSGFVVSALFVVSLMIAGVIVMAINFFTLIGTDETGIDGLAK